MTINLLKTPQALVPALALPDVSHLAINTNEVTTDVGMWALHFGIHQHHAEDLRRVLHILFPRAQAFVDGDGWNCWGEEIGTDVNDETTAHVVVHYDGDLSDAIAATVLIHEHAVPVVPMAGQSSRLFNGIVAALTDAEDWSESIAVWRIRNGALVGKIG